MYEDRFHFATCFRYSGTALSAHPWFEWAVAFFATWFVVGLYLDGWAHIHDLPDTFFTPWHAIIYSGVLGAALVLAGSGYAAWHHGASWRWALPAGYGLSLLGVGLFLITGVADFVWHLLFGIEADLEALYSPPHLLLAFAGARIQPDHSSSRANARGANWRPVQPDRRRTPDAGGGAVPSDASMIAISERC